MIILSESERAHFAAYCKQEAHQHDQMAQQMKKIGAIDKLERVRAVAFATVGAYIDPENWETVTVDTSKPPRPPI